MAKIVITVIRVRAISFPDIQTPLGMWLSGQAEPLTEGEEKPALASQGQAFLRLHTTQPGDGIIHAQQEFRASATRPA
jgi:hypothetical protein